MVCAGTIVVNGSFVSVVVTIGMNTEIGKIQSQIQEAFLKDTNTPLKSSLSNSQGTRSFPYPLVDLL